MKFFLILISFFAIFSFQTKLMTIDMLINNNKTYIIKNINDNMNISFDKNLEVNIFPHKIFYLIKLIFINNNIMNNCLTTKYKEYDTFYCINNNEKNIINDIKINLNLDNYTKTIKASELFIKKGNFYFFKFYSKPEIKSIIIGTKKKHFVNNLRLLESNNENEEKNKSDNYNNHTEENSDNSNEEKAGIGWLGISLIILLSLIVIYVIYVGFRYYRRKKYQNPSFYYKITEEMFDDITPIE